MKTNHKLFMKTNHKLFATCILTVVAVTLFTAGVMAAKSPASAEGAWSGFTVSTESGETVYTSQSEYSIQVLEYSADVGENDSVSFSMRANGSWNGDVEAHLTFYVDDGDNSIGFKIMNYWKAVRIVTFDKDGKQSFIRDAENYADNAGGNWNNKSFKWYDFKLVFSPAAFEVFVGEDLIMTAPNLGRFDFKNAKCRFSTWGCKASLKGISFSKSTGDADEIFGDCEKSTEGGDAVYTAVGEIAGGSPKNMYINATTGDANLIRFSFRPNAEWCGDDLVHTTFYIAVTPDKYLGFRLMNYWKASRIVLLDGDVFGVLAESKYVPMENFVEGWNGYDKWYDVTIYFTDEYLMLYVDGYATSFIHYKHGYDIHDKPVFIGNWGHYASVKNVSIEKADYNAFELGYSDFDFKTEQSLDAIGATNAAISFDNGCAVADINGADPKVTLNVNQKEHGSYSADMSIRNSVLLRLKNLTSATKMTVGIRTDASNNLYTKTVTLKSGDGFESYLINFSDYDLTGYLTEVNFSPVGVTTGSLVFDAVSFEREDKLYDYVGENMSCTADKETSTVTISGRLKKYRDHPIIIYSSPVNNYAESVYADGVAEVTRTTCDGNGDFSITLPFVDEKGYSRLNTLFLAVAGGAKLSKAFAVENYRDFIENPYSFELPALTVKVTDSPFNAVGDSYTDDTDAIQAAIDYVTAHGGGTVVIPGDESVYGGRRYMITHIRVKDNVELRIERGATLWQSPRAEDYKYDVIFGHNYISNSMWPHACNVNEPLILMKDATNVRITGGGTIRLADWGDRAEDSLSVTDPNRGQNCANIIHVAPVYINNCRNVELSDVTILHTNNWHVTTTYCTNMSIINVTMKDASCANSDGIGLAIANDVYIARNFLYSNDDAITLVPSLQDPRRHSWWNVSDYAGPMTVTNVEIEYNNMFGGLGLVFIAWGTESPDLENVATRNIVAHDNWIGGHQQIGSWPDNPFYGTSAYTTYNFNEMSDSSPVYDVYMYNNRYYGTYCDLSWALAPEIKAASTTFVTDNDYACSSTFINGSFERYLRFDTETEYTSGLTNWTFAGNGGTASTTVRGTKQLVAAETGNEHTVTDYAALISGGGQLYQGLYLKSGAYVFTAEYTSGGGTAQVFVGTINRRLHVTDPFGATVKNAVTLTASADYKKVQIVFEITKEGVYALGFAHSGDGSLIFDDCVIAEDEDTKVALTSAYLAIERANGVDTSLYTEESVSAMLTAVDDLRSVLNAQNLDRANIVEKTNGLSATLTALTEKPTEPDPGNSGDTSASDSGSSSNGNESASASVDTSAEQSSGGSQSAAESGSGQSAATGSADSHAASSSVKTSTTSASSKSSGGCGGNATTALWGLLPVVFAAILIRKKATNR